MNACQPISCCRAQSSRLDLKLTRERRLTVAGAEPEIEEGGVGAHIECGYLARIMKVLAFQGGLGACSPGKFLKFRPYESASVAVGNHHNHAKFIATGL